VARSRRPEYELSKHQLTANTGHTLLKLGSGTSGEESSTFGNLQEYDDMKVGCISELKSAINEHWKDTPAAANALKIINAIEAKAAPETKWRMADILSMLDTAQLTPDAVAALAILTQSEYAILRACGEFIDEEDQRHQLSSEEFQRVVAHDCVQHPVTRVEVTRASERVVPFFVLESRFI
jgi:hypothetical protein